MRKPSKRHLCIVCCTDSGIVVMGLARPPCTLTTLLYAVFVYFLQLTPVGSAFAKPLYIYSVGQKLCSTPVHISDSSIGWAPSFVTCFFELPSGHDVVALAFNVYADMLFFSDDKDGAIHRMQMETSSSSSNRSMIQIAANTGSVKGKYQLW
jgi:hypothetical protein